MIIIVVAACSLGRRHNNTRLLLHIEDAGDNAILNLGRRVVEDAAANFLLANSLFLVYSCLVEKFLPRGEALLFKRFEVIALEEAADAETNLSLGPVRLPEALLANLFKVSGTKSYNSSNQLLIFFFAPVVALLDIEILEVE